MWILDDTRSWLSLFCFIWIFITFDRYSGIYCRLLYFQGKLLTDFTRDIIKELSLIFLKSITFLNQIMLQQSNRKTSNMAQQNTIKINLQHNLSSLKIPQLKVDPFMTVLALKENVQRRYGSEPNYVKFVLKSKTGQFVTNMEEDMRSLDFYGVQPDMTIHILDLNPNSIHKQIENTAQIEKYVMSEETYDSLPQNFRKWKKGFLEENPQIKNPLTNQIEICDPDYLKSLAETMHVGQRCQLENGARGQIRFIGRVLEVGYGYFIGIELDQSVAEGGNGTLEGMHYFFSTPGKAVFVRPNKVEVGDFPKIEECDQI